MKIMKQILLTAIFSASALLANAQCNGFNWSEDAAQRATEEEKNVLYTDALKQKDFAGAQENLEWFLENNPKFNTSLYINGDKIYNGLIKAAPDDATKDEYINGLYVEKEHFKGVVGYCGFIRREFKRIRESSREHRFASRCCAASWFS